MNKFDILRIENAIWTLERYRNDLVETNANIVVEGVYVNTSDALKILDIALYKLSKQEESCDVCN